MPLLTSSIGLAGIANRLIPDPIGQAYNKVLKTGSWLISGASEFKKYQENNWEKLRLEADRYLNFERDPGKILWLTNLFLRENPVQMPKSMSEEEWGFLKTLWTKWIKGQNGATRNSIYTERLTQANHDRLLEGSLNLNDDYYTAWTTPYGGNWAKGKNPQSITAGVMSGLGCQVGYRQWAGLSLGSDHMWTIQLKVPSGTYTPEFPTYMLPDLFSSGGGTEFSFGTNCPAISYSLQWGNQISKQLNLFNEGSLHVPIGFSYNMMLDIDVVDDMHGSFKHYMNKYMNTIYSNDTASAYHYKEITTEVDIIVWKDGYIPKHMFKFYVVPYNYTPIQEGESNIATEFVKVSYSIVGLIRPNTEMEANIAPNSKGDWNNTKWTQVMLSPNNQ